jgi:hypothetical protein
VRAFWSLTLYDLPASQLYAHPLHRYLINSPMLMVEPGRTPSRATLMTGQYSLRNVLSLIIVRGSESTLSKRAVTGFGRAAQRLHITQ